MHLLFKGENLLIHIIKPYLIIILFIYFFLFMMYLYYHLEHIVELFQIFFHSDTVLIRIHEIINLTGWSGYQLCLSFLQDASQYCLPFSVILTLLVPELASAYSEVKHQHDLMLLLVSDFFKHRFIHLIFVVITMVISESQILHTDPKNMTLTWCMIYNSIIPNDWFLC